MASCELDYYSEAPSSSTIVLGIMTKASVCMKNNIKINFTVFFLVQHIGPITSYVKDKHSATKLHPQLKINVFSN